MIEHARCTDYKAAVQLYEEYLKHYPKDPGNDRVLYQMARAYEQGGELEPALATLDRLVKEYPHTPAIATKRSSAAARCCLRCQRLRRRPKPLTRRCSHVARFQDALL